MTLSTASLVVLETPPTVSTVCAFAGIILGEIPNFMPVSSHLILLLRELFQGIKVNREAEDHDLSRVYIACLFV